MNRIPTFPILEVGSRRGQRRLEQWLQRRDRILTPKLLREAGRIVNGVRRRGDSALLEAVERYEGVRVERVSALRLELSGLRTLAADVDPTFRAAFERAWERILRFHQEQRRSLGKVSVHGVGFRTEEERTPLERVALYLPGGRASYPSTLLMGFAAARAAGTREFVVACPHRVLFGDLRLKWALSWLGVSEAWGMGGAHAVAALAWGTETIAPVEFLAGPGNAWVTAAKTLVSGRIGIDGLMGPSEVVIVAAGRVSPQWIAADLLAQAEHDPQAGAMLVTWDRNLAVEVVQELLGQLPGLSTRAVAAEALRRFGVALIVSDLEEAVALVRRLAPEHLQLVGGEVEAAVDRFRPAGAVFVGAGAPEVFGDYLAGPSHILPTCGAARFASPLGTETFLRRSHRLEVWDPIVVQEWGRDAAVLALAEGLPGHARAAAFRAGTFRGEGTQ